MQQNHPTTFSVHLHNLDNGTCTGSKDRKYPIDLCETSTQRCTPSSLLLQGVVAALRVGAVTYRRTFGSDGSLLENLDLSSFMIERESAGQNLQVVSQNRGTHKA